VFEVAVKERLLVEEAKADSSPQEMETEKPFNPSDYGYTVYEKWEYPQIIYKMDHEQSWIDIGASCYRGAQLLIEGVAKGSFSEDVEGVAGLQLFRHYLELVLKRIVFWGRMLERPDKNAVLEEVEKVAHIHDLAQLWKWVIRDAKPKINGGDWSAYDIGFVEQLVMDFDGIDKKGFAFRYHGHGAESLRFNFEKLFSIMEHAEQVLEAILTYLMETHGQNEEWEQIQASW
jgi:hypothetical protein